MKKTIAMVMALLLAVSALALPALAEDTSAAPDQITSATQQGTQTARGGRGGQRRMPGQSTQGGQAPQMPGQGTQDGQMPQMPGQGTQQQAPGQGTRSGKSGKSGSGVQGRKQGKLSIFDQLLADGVITQEIYDAITAWMNQRMQPQQQEPAAPAEGAEPPAVPEGAQAEPSAQEDLLKELLDSGVITQDQYDLLSGGSQSAPAVPEAPETPETQPAA